MNYDHPPLLDQLAAQYVLGTLGFRARRRFRRHLLSSRQAREAVSAWEQRLHGLAAPVPAVAPPPRVWQGIADRLPGASGRVKQRHPGTRGRWLAWVSPALGLAFGLVASIALVRQMPEHFVALDQLAQRQQALPQSYIGLLVDGDGHPAVLASATRHGQRLAIKVLQPLAVPEGKILQLWALPRDKEGRALAPLPLGEVPARGAGAIALADSAEALLSNVSVLGVTLRDAPAKPGEVPGEFLLQGHCVKLW